MAVSDPCDTQIATAEDVIVRIGHSIDSIEELARIDALLDDAASAARFLSGQPFGAMTVTDRFRARNGVIWISARDISAVTSVRTIGGTEAGNVTQTVVAFTWDGLHSVNVGGGTNRFDFEPSVASTYEVVYVRTGDLAPQWVVAIVAQMAARAFGRPADQTAVTQESIAGYSYSVGAAAAAGGVGVLPQEAAMLGALRPVGGTAWVGLR